MSAQLFSRPIGLLLAVIFVCVASCIALSGTAHAWDDTGGGGSGCYGGFLCSDNGAGWYVFDSAGPGPNYGVSQGSWPAAQAKCRSMNARYIIGFVVKAYPGSSGMDGRIYKRDPAYNGFPFSSGPGFISEPEAHRRFDSMSGQWTVFGVNTALFCWEDAKDWNLDAKSSIQAVPNVSAQRDKNKSTQGGTVTVPINDPANLNAPIGSGLFWWHSLYNGGPDEMDKPVDWRVDKSGFGTSGWNDNRDPQGRSPLLKKNQYLMQSSPNLPNPSPFSTYTITQADVGSTLCQNLFWSPGSGRGGGTGSSKAACAYVPYKYSLTPSVTTSPDDYTDPGATITVMPKVDNAGPTKSRPTAWQISFVTVEPNRPIPGGGVGGGVPCSKYNGPGVSCKPLATGNSVFMVPPLPWASVPSTIPDLPVGTRVCHGLSLKPYRSADDVWRYSELACITVAKSPLVQVKGGDLIVGRNQVGSQVRTNTKTIAGKSYGSWTEYAIIPSGAVFGMASAAGYAGGISGLAPTKQQCQVSQLTFTNATISPATKKPECTGATANFGGYQLGGVAPSIASRFPVSQAADLPPAAPSTPAGKVIIDTNSLAAGNYKVSGDFSLETSGTIGAGKWYVINAGASTVTISKDIFVDSGAPLTKQQQIPQIVIIAKNIIIADNVKQIDAWLVATGTGATDGFIKTCATTAQPQGASQCTEKLVVNGPIQANHLFMSRTAGAGTGNNSGDPAEVFNLRADAYIWASSVVPGNNRVPTVYSKELPPRF